jgi:hypothetical protein
MDGFLDQKMSLYVVETYMQDGVKFAPINASATLTRAGGFLGIVDTHCGSRVRFPIRLKRA